MTAENALIRSGLRHVVTGRPGRLLEWRPAAMVPSSVGDYPAPVELLGRPDVWPDGNGFLMISADETPPTALHVVINWHAELELRLAAQE